MIEADRKKAGYQTIKDKLNFPGAVEIVRPIGVDLYLAGLNEATNLPQTLVNHPKLAKLAQERRALNQELDSLFSQVPDVNLGMDAALSQGLVQAEALAALYDHLSDFLTKDPNHGRIILYLPFSFLPDLHQVLDQSANLVAAKRHFKTAYQDAWTRLLHERDVGASFLDGDVLEPGLGEPQRVRKAAHLLPGALEKGLLDPQDVLDLLAVVTDEELRRSLVDGLYVAREQSLPTSPELTQLYALADSVDNALPTPNQADLFSRPPIESSSVAINRILSNLDHHLAAIYAQYAPDSPQVHSISQARALWEQGVKVDEAISGAVSQLLLVHNISEIPLSELETWCEPEAFSEDHQITVLRTLSQIVKTSQALNPAQAASVVPPALRLIHTLWEDTSSLRVKDEIVTTLSHLNKLEIISDTVLQPFGLVIPDLSSPLPVDLRTLAPDLSPLVKATQKLKAHPVLSQSLYPVILACGSRIKGYASFESDVDLAIMVRPSVSWAERDTLLHHLAADIPEIGTIGKVLEFWLDDTQGSLGFRTPPYSLETVIGAPQIHFIFGGVWIGQATEYYPLASTILGKYLDLSRFGDQKEAVRRQLLRQLELDMLQFRLMHKGYRRFYPSQKQPGSPHAHLIGWESDFYDPGYRRIATQLFLSRVFLPDLS